MKKFLATILSLTFALSAFAGCNPTQSGKGNEDGFTGTNGVVDNVDGPNKTEITMYVYQGGEGTDWLSNAAELFAEANLETPFASGKEGVYVNVQPGETNTALFGTIASEGYNIYCTSTRQSVADFAANSLMLEITDVVTDTSRVGGSIESNLYEGVVDSLKLGDSWYALPSTEYYPGLSYNRNVFDKCLSYIADDSVAVGEGDEEANEYVSDYGTIKLVNSLTTKKSVGTDGEAGTADDGLPRSLEEMLVLMGYIKEETDYYPVTVSGQYTNYANYFVEGLWVALAGYEQMRNYYNCTGEIEIVTDYYDEPIFEGIDYIKKPKIEKVTLTDETGYLGNDMAAKYYAFAMLEIMEREGFFSPVASYSNTVDHFGAQKYLLYDGLGKYSNSKTAMLMEGSYWFNETIDGGCLEDYRKAGGNVNSVDCRFMPLPTSYTQDSFVAGNKTTLLDGSRSYMFINGNIKGNAELEKASKAFLAFLYTDEQNRAHASQTGSFRAMNYTLSATEIANINPFYQDLMKLREENGANIIYCSGKGNYNGTFAKAYPSIYIALSSNSNMPQDGVLNILRYSDQQKEASAASKNVLEYVYGARKAFEDCKISASFWNTLNIGA